MGVRKFSREERRDFRETKRRVRRLIGARKRRESYGNIHRRMSAVGEAVGNCLGNLLPSKNEEEKQFQRPDSLTTPAPRIITPPVVEQPFFQLPDAYTRECLGVWGLKASVIAACMALAVMGVKELSGEATASDGADLNELESGGKETELPELSHINRDQLLDILTDPDSPYAETDDEVLMAKIREGKIKVDVNGRHLEIKEDSKLIVSADLDKDWQIEFYNFH